VSADANDTVKDGLAFPLIRTGKPTRKVLIFLIERHGRRPVIASFPIFFLVSREFRPQIGSTRLAPPPATYLILLNFLSRDKDSTYPGLVPPGAAKRAVETKILVSDFAISPLSLCRQN
jgi:hypothetical protein